MINDYTNPPQHIDIVTVHKMGHMVQHAGYIPHGSDPVYPITSEAGCKNTNHARHDPPEQGNAEQSFPLCQAKLQTRIYHSHVHFLKHRANKTE
jgi:hypothetical protein